MPKIARYLLIALVLTAAAIPGAWAITRQTDAYQGAASYINDNKVIREHLGDIQSITLPLLGYNIHVVGAEGTANFNLKVKGSRASGIAYVQMTKQGTWHPVVSRLALQGGSTIVISP